MNRDRINTIQRHLEKSKYSKKRATGKYKTSHARIRAKLIGFTQSFEETLREYPNNDHSIEATYARAIAYYRIPKLVKAINLINKLIDLKPNDPFFHELKGQFYFENGKIDLSLKSYQNSVDLFPDSALLRAQLGRTQIEKNDPSLLKLAITNLQFSLKAENRRPGTWRQLGIAYGRLGNKGKSFHALAEEAILLGRNEEAIRIAERAKKHSTTGSPNWLRSEDIINMARQKIRNKRRLK